MERWKKLVLLALGVVDIAVVGVLGYIVWQTQQPQPTPTPSFAPCAQLVLDQLPGHLSPTATWTAERLDLRLTAWYEVPRPPRSSGQLLWTALDALPEAVRVGCTLPSKIVVVVTGHGTQATVGHIAELDGEDIMAWSQGQLDEEVLAKRGDYRLSGQAPSATPLLPERYPQ